MPTDLAGLASIFGRKDRDSGLVAPGEDLTAVEMAARRKAWRESAGHVRIKRMMWTFVAGLPIAIAVSVLVQYIQYSDWSRENASIDYYFPAIGVGLYIYCLLGVTLVAGIRVKLMRDFRDRLLLGEAESDVLRAEESAAGEGADIQFASLWFATQRRLDYYHKIATSQARQSFLNAQIAAGLGFLVLVISAVVAGVADSASASIVAGATGVFGAALGGYMGTTFVRMQQDASTRLRAYFLQPLEFSRVLAAERLVESLDGSPRDQALLMIIRSVSGSGAESEIEEPSSKAPSESSAK